METETLDISATNFNSSWPIIHGSLEDAITSESSISSVDSVPALKPPLILRRPSPDSGPCEITISFTQQHEIKQVYVRSTARVYEIYYSANEKGENEYLCTVRCGVAAKSEELLQETDGVGSLPISSCSPNSSSCDGHLRSDSGGSTNEDDWVDVKVRNSAMLDEGTPLSKIDESCMERGNQDYFEATAEISDADPFLSITLRLLSIQSGDCIYIDEVYVFADPVVSIDTNSSTNAPESSSESAKMSLLIPTLLSLSNIRRNQMQEQSDSAVGERKHQDTGVKSTSTFVSSNTSQSESIQGTTLNSAPVHMSQPEFPMQKPDSQMNPHSNSERNELSCSRIEKTLDELVSRVAKIEDFFLRFEEKMVKPISNMEGRLERVEQQLELFAKTVGSVKACNRISAPDFSGIDSESKSIFNEGNGSPSTTNSESIKKDESRPPDMSIPSSDVYSSPSVLPNNMSSSSSNAAPLIPSLVVTAPDFSCVDDEGESDACEAVKDSPKGNLKKPLSINDALASALAGFLSSASKDTDVVEETAYISSKEENGSPCPSESSDSILSDEHVVSSVDVDWYNISTKDDIVLTEKEFFNAGKGFEETTESVELQNCVIVNIMYMYPSNTLQEETLWIEVTIQDAELEKVNAYTSCSNCCKRTNLPMQKRYSCSSCLNKECICTERISFKFEASDTTGTMAFTTFNDDTERLFRKTAAEIYAIKESDDHNAFKTIQDLLSSTPFYIKVGPTWHLGQNNVLEWTLRAIELKENPHTQEAEQLSAGYFSQEKDASEKVPENTIESGNSEPFIPTPNLKKNSDKHTQEEPYTETLDTPQQSIESLKRKKSLGKSPMEFESEESESQVPLSQVGAKKKLCFGGMTTKKDTAGQNPTIPLAKDRVEDVAEPLGSEHRQTTPIIVKTEKVNKPSVESATKEK